MKIIVNGQQLETEAMSLAGILDELGYRDAVVATALNGAFVPVSLRETQTVTDGDLVEVVAPMQGG